MKDAANDDLVGIVQIDLNPLLRRDHLVGGSQSYKGWFPIYSIENGIQGELYVEVDLKELVDNNAAFASGNISFFSGSVPAFLEVRHMLGFVEELIEVKRISADKDNEAQVQLYETILKLRRKLARLVLKRGGNAICTYRQSIDHESGGENKDKQKQRLLTVRGYGTAVQVGVNENAA